MQVRDTDRIALVEKASELRSKGYSFSRIGELMGITKGHAWSLTGVRVPRQPPPAANDNSVIRLVPFNGGWSNNCGTHAVRMPRIASLDGAFAA